MSIALVINGVTYDYPEVDDTDWGPDATDWASAVTSGMLQKAGGLFQLLAEVDFGTSFGIKSLYIKSRTANVADAGPIRLARADAINWRNQANSGNLSLSVDASDNLLFNGASVVNGVTVGDTATIDLTLAGSVLSADIVALSITNAFISASAAIAYSKLNLASSIVNADISGSAAIAYSKLNLSGAIVNADIGAAAAIAYSKLAALTADRALVSDGSGFVSVATTTATEIGYVNGVTSAIQTQIDSKLPTTITTTGDIIYSSSGATAARLGIGSTGQNLTVSSGIPAWAYPAYRSVTTTDGPTLADHTLNCSGASFAITLPTAVGCAGKIFEIVHGGTSLSQIYTLATTSAQTIGGVASGAYVLYTNGESLRIQSDGANWIILDHRAVTDWASYTPTYTGLGTVSASTAHWRRQGPDLLVRARVTLGTRTATEARIAFPADTPASTSAMATTEVAGTMNSDGNFGGSYAILREASVAYFTVGYSTNASGGAITKVLGNAISANGAVWAYWATAPITGWQP